MIYIADFIKFRNFNSKIARFYGTTPQVIWLNSGSTIAWGWSLTLLTAWKNIFARKVLDMGQQ
jgi:hypothetical protein